MNKGNGQHPQGVRWLMINGLWRLSYWVTAGRYVHEEVLRWECSSPLRPLYPLDIEL